MELPFPYRLRSLRPEDNAPLHRIITDTVLEHGITESDYLHGCAAEAADIYSQYQQPGSDYWVIENTETKEVVGGAGYAPLMGTKPQEGICEAQKMYFRPEARGKGLAWLLLERIIREARNADYKTVYIETHPNLKRALSIYEKFGFRYIPMRKGNTGHDACTVYMEYSLR